LSAVFYYWLLLRQTPHVSVGRAAAKIVQSDHWGGKSRGDA